MFVPAEKGMVKVDSADDLEEKRANGWKEPTNKMANGHDYNEPDMLLNQDATAEVARTRAAYEAKKAAKADDK